MEQSNLCLLDIRKELSISLSAHALKEYSSNFEKAYSLSKEVAIFLDTNVLLSYYGMAASEKKKLLTFLKTKKSNIYLSAQVQEEFRKNRVKNIEKDLFEPLRKIPESFTSASNDIKNKFDSVLNSNKKILESDYPEEWKELVIVRDQLINTLSIDKTLKKLQTRISETTADFKDVKVKDELLFACAELNITPRLDAEEISSIEKLYDELIENHDKGNVPNKHLTVIPGAGDYKKKEYPYGDFIIYHEMLKFLKSHDKHVVFLTNEKSKGDWIASDHSPHIHYVEHTYALTDKILYILNAENPLSLSFANIHEIATPTTDSTPREGLVFSIDHEKGYGFIYNEAGSIYFNSRSFSDISEFRTLRKNDYLRFTLTHNNEGKDVAINCTRPSYSFSVGSNIHRGSIIKLKERYGFVKGDLKNLYFHSLTVDESCDFSDFKVGDTVEYVIGVNLDGDPIIRKIRLPIDSE